MKKLCLLTIFICVCHCVSAQNEEFKKSYEEFRLQSKENYNSFREKANEDYADFVRQAWEQFQVLPAIPLPKDEPIPPVVMPEEDEDKPIKDNELSFDGIVPIEEPSPQPTPPAPIKEQPTPVEQYYTFNFFGTECKVRLNDALRFKLANCNESNVADMWLKLSYGDYDNLIRDCLELRLRHNLCDWAYLCMLQSLCESFCGKDSNEATLLMAYLYCQSGYKMRLAQSEGKLYMLFASKHLLYTIPMFVVDGTQYYPLGFEKSSLYISQASFPNEQPMSLYIPNEQNFAMSASPTKVRQSERYPEIKTSMSSNKNLMDFYSTYPSSMIDENFCTRWAMYANTPMSDNVKEQIYPTLRSAIKDCNQLTAVNKLLNYVQTGFVYEYDDKVWGCDRAFFAEESLYYPYCDCEDRSILFTRLVRDLLGLKCILIYYPGHLASAVCFTDNTVQGDYIMLNGKKFVVADATYINAPVGKTMPGMDNNTATVILLQ